MAAYRSLYGAGPATVLDYVHGIQEGVGAALVVGHNPTMFELVWELLPGFGADDDEPGSDRAVLEVHGFPTCAMAVLALRAPSWARVTPGCASLEGLFKPPY